MADKSVERIDPPFPENWDVKAAGGDDVAYVMIYTHVDDRIESVSFSKTGAELGRAEGDFRHGSASWKLKETKPAAEVVPGVRAVERDQPHRETPLPHKSLPDPPHKAKP